MYDRAIHFPQNNPVFLKLSATLNDTFRLILFYSVGRKQRLRTLD